MVGSGNEFIKSNIFGNTLWKISPMFFRSQCVNQPIQCLGNVSRLLAEEGAYAGAFNWFIHFSSLPSPWGLNGRCSVSLVAFSDSCIKLRYIIISLISNLYWWGKGWPVDGLPFPDTGCPVPDVSIYYMSNINELPDGILFHWFCKCTPPWMFLPLDIPSEYRPEHVTFGLLCVIFKFPSRIFCRRVPGFATDCPCGVWCRGLTTCLLYVGPPLEF